MRVVTALIFCSNIRANYNTEGVVKDVMKDRVSQVFFLFNYDLKFLRF